MRESRQQTSQISCVWRMQQSVCLSQGSKGSHEGTHGRKTFLLWHMQWKLFKPNTSKTPHWKPFKGPRETSRMWSLREKILEKTQLSSHMKKHGEKKFKCSWDGCDKAFLDMSCLNKHISIHSGLRPFNCTVCDKSFARSDCFKKHTMIHTGEKLYRCNICSAAFIWGGCLSRHKRTHTGERPYPCKLCSKKFTQNAGLKTHMRLHTGERLHQCDMCDKAFTDKSNLLQHRQIHTELKNHKCDECEQLFSRKSGLKRHKERFHSEKDREA